MNKRVLVLLTLVALGNGAWAMENTEVDPQNIESPQGLGFKFGKKVDTTLATASKSLDDASKIVDGKVFQPVRNLTDTTQNGKHRGVITGLLRRGQQWWNPEVTKAMIGLLPLPTDPNYAYYKQFTDETTQLYKEVKNQYEVGKAMPTDPTQTLTGDDQVTKFIKRSNLLIRNGNDTFGQIQTLLNGPNRQKGPGVKKLAFLLRHSRQLTNHNQTVMPRVLFEALTNQQAIAQQTTRRAILENINIGKSLAAQGYDYQDLCGDNYDYSSGEEGSRSQVKALMTRPPSPLTSNSSPEDTPDDDKKDGEKEKEEK